MGWRLRWDWEWSRDKEGGDRGGDKKGRDSNGDREGQAKGENWDRIIGRIEMTKVETRVGLGSQTWYKINHLVEKEGVDLISAYIYYWYLRI